MSEPETTTCGWFAMCTNLAVGDPVPHPAFPDGVPVCERCRAWIKSMS